MNLGAFMDPEFPIFSTTLCYIVAGIAIKINYSLFISEATSIFIIHYSLQTPPKIPANKILFLLP